VGEKQKIYNPVIDILRTISIFAVILIHTTTKTIGSTSNDLLKVPWSLFLNQISRFTVPLFFMISGFVLELNYHADENYLTYLKKRFSRIFIPYFIWTIIYYFFVYNRGRNLNFLPSLLNGTASYQLYFIPSLLILYLFFPLIHKFSKIIGNKWIMFALFLFELLLLYNDYNIKSLPIYYPLNTALLNYFVFIFGMSLARNQEAFLNFIKKWKLILFLGTVTFAILIFLEGLTGYLATHNYLTFYSNWRPSTLVYTIFFAGFFYWLFNRKLKFITFIKALSQLSFFVFFVHIIFIEIFWLGFLRNILMSNKSIAQTFWYDPLFFLSVTIASFGVAFIAHKIPYLSKFTG
jgi:probable poly-beta-1,6-N-acetyl-D-glucosamine export protein